MVTTSFKPEAKIMGQFDQRYIVPALLLLGWIVGCSVVVYYIFS
ncbi:sarcoplasmic/endoplasmic reticulum calcium ATPase regulator DWORF-like [Leucoraja erinacea]|nr:sarcoplasmic/endoplasmic reticulum calcium ATPase regulator DWORF-like [Leucoraja erinacea]